MAFKNEYIPPIEQETSEFFKKARETLKTGYSRLDNWTVDRENNRVLNWSAGGREYETRNDEGWTYIDSTGRYSFWTRKDFVEALPQQVVSITRTIITVWQDSYLAGMPSKETWGHIKEALETTKDSGVRSNYSDCKLTLILNGEAV